MTWYENPEEFFLELPLYSELSWESNEVFPVAKLLHYRGTIDSYCLGCSKESTFHGQNGAVPSELTRDSFDNKLRLHAAAIIPSGRIASRLSKPKPPLIPPEIYRVSFCCGRNETHTMKFLYLVQNQTLNLSDDNTEITQYLEKIGQYPSLAELNLPQIQKYRSILLNSYSDYSRGIGLAAHDVGIGAYVYLRRVFESLVEEAHDKAKDKDGWDDAEYLRIKMTKRVKALKDYLPKFLVDHPEMYSLLSKGLHELSEDECLKHFSALRVGIDLILDEKIEEKARKIKLAEASQAIKDATNSVK